MTQVNGEIMAPGQQSQLRQLLLRLLELQQLQLLPPGPLISSCCAALVGVH